MRTSFKIHAGVALAQSIFSLAASAATLLPGSIALAGGGTLLMIQAALLFTVFVAAVIRGIGVEAGGVRFRGNLQRRYWNALPAAVRITCVAICATGVLLAISSQVGAPSKQAEAAEAGRYYATDLTNTHHKRVEVSEKEYQHLLKRDRRGGRAIVAVLADGAAVTTLIIGKFKTAEHRTGISYPPHQSS